MNSEFVEPIGFSFVRDLRAQVFQPFHDFSGKFFEFVKVHRSGEALRVDLRFKYPNATRAAVGRGIAGKRGFSNRSRSLADSTSIRSRQGVLRSSVTTPATLCLTVENEDTFHELAATNPGVLLILTSYAGSAVRRLLDLLPGDLRFLHFGDGDPAGSDILRDLRQKSGRDIQPLLVPGYGSHKRRPLADADRTTLKRLMGSDLPVSLLAHLETLLENGVPVDFEQEGIPIHKVWEVIASDSRTTVTQP